MLQAEDRLPAENCNCTLSPCLPPPHIHIQDTLQPRKNIYVCAYLVEYKSGTITQPLIFQNAFTNKVYIEFYKVYSKPLHQIQNAASELRKMT